MNSSQALGSLPENGIVSEARGQVALNFRVTLARKDKKEHKMLRVSENSSQSSTFWEFCWTVQHGFLGIQRRAWHSTQHH